MPVYVPPLTAKQVAALQNANLSLTKPPTFIVCNAENNTPPPSFAQNLINAGLIPGMNPMVKIPFTSCLNTSVTTDGYPGDFSLIKQAESYFPANSLLQIVLIALPVVPTPRYRTLYMPLSTGSGKQIPVYVPWFGDSGFSDPVTGDWRLGCHLLNNWLVGTGRFIRVFCMGACFITGHLGDAETQIPSTTRDVNGNLIDLSPYYTGGLAGDGTMQPGVGYTEQIAQQSFYNCAKGQALEFPGVPFQVAWLNPTQQALGEGDDPYCTVANTYADAIQAGAIAGGSVMVPIIQSFSVEDAPNNDAFHFGMAARYKTGMYAQLTPLTNTKDEIIAAVSRACGENISLIQAHGGTQPQVLHDFFQNYGFAPSMLFSQGIARTSQGSMFTSALS